MERLESMPGFDLLNGQLLSCLAFADDLVLLELATPKAQSVLYATVDYLGALAVFHPVGDMELVIRGMD